MPEVTVLLSSPPVAAGDGLRKLITNAGFAASDHVLGSTPAVDFAPVAVAVVDVCGQLDAARDQIRRWRAELGDQVVPLLWVSAPEALAAGLDAGADAALPRPVDSSLFTAQLQSLARVQSTCTRITRRADEARLLGTRLGKALDQIEREQALTRRLRELLVPRTLPEVGSARVHVFQRSRDSRGGDFYNAVRLDEEHIGFLVGDVVGSGAGMLGLYVQQLAQMKQIGKANYRIVLPDELLGTINRELLNLEVEDLPLVALLAGTLNTATGSLTLARAGIPAPVYVPRSGEPVFWSRPGPFLGSANATYEPITATLAPGDRVLIGTDGTRPDGCPGGSEHLLAAAGTHADRTGSAFVDSIARELLQQLRHGEDFTLMGVEMITER